jgi:AcrR family transcriptional regulator
MDIGERIINACQALALNQGLHRFTMDALAARAGVSKRTIYRYFPSKEAVIEATLDDFMQRTAAEVQQMLAQEKNPPALINRLVSYLLANGRFLTNRATLNDLRLYYPHLWKKIDSFRLRQMRSVLGQLMESNPALRQDIDPRIIAAVMTAVVQNVLQPDFILENNLSFEETVRQISLLFSSFFSPRL